MEVKPDTPEASTPSISQLQSVGHSVLSLMMLRDLAIQASTHMFDKVRFGRPYLSGSLEGVP
jgi:hypothetical protein